MSEGSQSKLVVSVRRADGATLCALPRVLEVARAVVVPLPTLVGDGSWAVDPLLAAVPADRIIVDLRPAVPMQVQRFLADMPFAPQTIVVEPSTGFGCKLNELARRMPVLYGLPIQEVSNSATGYDTDRERVGNRLQMQRQAYEANCAGLLISSQEIPSLRQGDLWVREREEGRILMADCRSPFVQTPDNAPGYGLLPPLFAVNQGADLALIDLGDEWCESDGLVKLAVSRLESISRELNAVRSPSYLREF